jgi:methylglutaconyl-CoA hydratase
MHPTHARELMLTGARVSAERAKEAGLVTAVAPDDALDAVTASYVEQLMLGGPEALARTKELLRRVPTMPRDEAFAWTAEVSAGLFTSEEAREGMTAFLQRRSPAWAPADRTL